MGGGGSEHFDGILVVRSKNRGKSIFSQHLTARIVDLSLSVYIRNLWLREDGAHLMTRNFYGKHLLFTL